MNRPVNPWDARYQTDEYVYGVNANAFLAEKHGLLVPKGETLAIAEGEGRNAVYLAEQGMNVTAWDYAPAAIDKTNRLAAERGVAVHAEVVDLHTANWEKERWDQIVCVFGHFPTPLRLRTLREVRDAVKPNGYFISEVYSVYQPPYRSGGPDDPDLLYRPEEFLQTFDGWRIVHMFMGEVDRHEGKLHNGLSHVIQFVGQKI